MAGTAGYDVFLSYSRADEDAAATSCAPACADAGLEVFLDRYALPGGRPWQPELEAALASLPRAGRPARPHRHRRLAAPRDPARPRPPDSAEKTRRRSRSSRSCCPACSPTTSRSAPSSPSTPGSTCAPASTSPKPCSACSPPPRARRSTASPATSPACAPIAACWPSASRTPACSSAASGSSEELVAKVRQRSDANVVAVLGRSGSGKSSVVFAGLFPALRQEKGAGQQAVWQILDLRPGAEPLHALVETFDPPDDGLSRSRRARPRSTPRPISCAKAR